MTSTRSINDLKGPMSPAAVAKAEAMSWAARVEMLLAEVAKQQAFTRAEMAGTFGVGQPPVPEAADDLPLSTLRRLVAALGCGLEVAVVMPDGRRIDLLQLSEIALAPADPSRPETSYQSPAMAQA